MFDKIYWLHCVEDKDRLPHLQAQQEKQDILKNTEIWWTCRQPHCDVIIKALMNARKGIDLTKPAEFNCMREHYTIIKQAYLRGFKSVLIFEDDCFIIKDKAIWEAFMNNIPEDYNILRLGGLCDFDHPELIDLYKQGIYWTKPNFGLWSTAGYALDRKGMKYFIKFCDNLFVAADMPLFWNTNTLPYLGYTNFHKDDVIQYVSTLPLIYLDKTFESSIREQEFDSVFNYYKSIRENKFENISIDLWK